MREGRVRHSFRGVSLGTVLLVVVIVATLGFALAGASVTNLRLMQRSTNEMQAANLARSAVARGLERILDRQAFGASRSEDDSVEVVFAQGPAESVGRLAFNRDGARRLGIPFSTNNLAEAESQEGSTRVVPGHGIHLVGVGQCGGVTRTVEAVYHSPPYPYAIAAAGQVTSSGSLLVAGLPESGLTPETRDEDLPPADMAANDAGERSVVLGTPTLITGDVQTAGLPVIPESDDIRILGLVKSGAAPVVMPELNPADYDPRALERRYEPLEEGVYSEGPTVLEGAVRKSGSVTFSGGLELDGAMLYVDGDLTVHGGLSGKGIVAATGEVTLNGGANLAGANNLAIVADGKVTLRGSGPSTSFLQGLVYTEGPFEAEQVTVVGTLIAGSTSSLPEPVSLRNVRFYRPQKPVPISITLGGGGSSTTGVVPIYPHFSFDTGGRYNLDREVNRGQLEIFGMDLDYDTATLTFMPRATDNPPSTYTLTTNPGHVYSYDTMQVRGWFEEVLGKEFVDLGLDDTWGQKLDTVSYWFAEKLIGILNEDPIDFESTTVVVTDDSPPLTITIDPSEFLSPTDRVRLALWRER